MTGIEVSRCFLEARGGGVCGKVRSDQLIKGLECTTPQPKELGLDAGEQGTGLSRQGWPGQIYIKGQHAGGTGGKAWRKGCSQEVLYGASGANGSQRQIYKSSVCREQEHQGFWM